MTVIDTVPADVGSPTAPTYASWSRRVVAALLDGAVLGAVAWTAAGDGIAAPSLQPTFDSGPDTGALPWTSSAVVVTAFVLMLLLQGLTGQTPGRRVVGIEVVRAPAEGPVGGPPGVVRSLLRCWAHLLDAIGLVGYLRPLWHEQGRTFADSLVGTVVLRRAPRADGRGGAVTVGAWLVVILVLTFGVRVSDTTGVTPQVEVACLFQDQDQDQEPAPAPRVERATLVRAVQWREARSLSSWTGGTRHVERELVTLEVEWEPSDLAPTQPLVVRTTVDGATVVNDVPGEDGLASLPVEGVGSSPVDVEVQWMNRTLATCSATLPPAG